ncbi:MAG: BACON domain-containing protein [Bacteroidales bacterium]|nr:BACON domain-containing protein [Bacteroidales bacterium]
MKTKNLFIIAMAVLGLFGCRKDNLVLSSCDLWFPIEGDTTTITIEANCNWTISIDGDVDWLTVTPMSSLEASDGLITVVAQPCLATDFRTASFTVISEHGHFHPTVTVTQKKEAITLSKYEFWFPTEASTKSIEINANCKWTLNIDDGADWYSVSPTSGEPVNQGSLSMTVQPYEGDGYRSSLFTLTSEHGFEVVTVYLSQNKLEFEEIFNLVFGVSKVEYWNTDYFGQMIEDSYRHREYNPYDTTTGYMMYFFDDGTGIQRDHHEDSVVYYLFSYDYNAANRTIRIEFETVSDTLVENYSASVLTASEELFRFVHEYKPNSWERADMRKVGTINPGEKSLLKRIAKRRKSSEGIFIF